MLLLEIKEMAKQVLDVNFNLSSNLDPSSIFEALEIRLAFHSHSDKKKWKNEIFMGASGVLIGIGYGNLPKSLIAL